MKLNFIPLDSMYTLIRSETFVDPDDIDLDWMAREANIWIHYKQYPQQVIKYVECGP